MSFKPFKFQFSATFTHLLNLKDFHSILCIKIISLDRQPIFNVTAVIELRHLFKQAISHCHVSANRIVILLSFNFEEASLKTVYVSTR